MLWPILPILRFYTSVRRTRIRSSHSRTESVSTFRYMCEKHCFCAYKSILSIVGSLHSNTFISYSVAVLVTSSPRIFYQHQSQFVWVAFHTVSVPSTMLLLLLPQLLLLWLLLLTFPSLCKLCILFGARWESFMLHTSHSLRNTNTVRRMRAKNKMYESQRVLSTLPFFCGFPWIWGNREWLPAKCISTSNMNSENSIPMKIRE